MDKEYTKVTTQTIKDKKGIAQSIKNLFESQPYQALVKTCSDLKDVRKMKTYEDLKTGMEGCVENSVDYMYYTVNRLGGCKDKSKILEKPDQAVKETFEKKYPSTKNGLGKLWGNIDKLIKATPKEASRSAITEGMTNLLEWLAGDGGMNWYPRSTVLQALPSVLAKMDMLDLVAVYTKTPKWNYTRFPVDFAGIINQSLKPLCAAYSKIIKKGTKQTPNEEARRGILKDWKTFINKRLLKDGVSVDYSDYGNGWFVCPYSP